MPERFPAPCNPPVRSARLKGMKHLMIRTLVMLGLLIAAVGCAAAGSGDRPTPAVGTTAGAGDSAPSGTTSAASTSAGSSPPGTPPPADSITPPSTDAVTPPPADAVTPPPTSTPGRPMSTTVLPTLSRPTAPPSSPTDVITGLRVVGEITVGGEGPCYTLTADDGRVFTVSGRGGTLAAGDRVTARVSQGSKPVYCGDVEAWTLLEIVPGG